MQPGDDEAARFDRGADFRRFRGGDFLRRSMKRKRRDLQAVIAKTGGELALPLQRHTGQNLVAQGNPHLFETPVYQAGREVSRRSCLETAPVIVPTSDLNAGI